MGLGLVAGLASAGLASLAMAQDILFHSSMTDTQEYSQATDVLGYTGKLLPEPATGRSILTQSHPSTCRNA